MSLSHLDAAELLRSARALDQAQAYPDLVALLEPWPGESLEVEPELLFLRADVARRVGRPDDADDDLARLHRRIA
ncbi:MAG: hypothetical protein KDA28_10200, partial [Phycisphaerales bacterium]|nr:hypothetical protein [Phycisphaerales bacterium]